MHIFVQYEKKNFSNDSVICLDNLPSLSLFFSGGNQKHNFNRSSTSLTCTNQSFFFSKEQIIIIIINYIIHKNILGRKTDGISHFSLLIHWTWHITNYIEINGKIIDWNRKKKNPSDIDYQPEMKVDVQEEDPLFGRYPLMSLIKLTIINIQSRIFSPII
jgi:hypothetical protein